MKLQERAGINFLNYEKSNDGNPPKKMIKMPFKTNNSFNSTMMASFLPVIVGKKNKQTKKIWLLLQCITNSHKSGKKHLKNTKRKMTPSDVPRRGTCLALRFQTGSWMLFIDSCLSDTLFPGCDRRPHQLTTNCTVSVTAESSPRLAWRARPISFMSRDFHACGIEAGE